jgi:apolipoprotein N-acyltransferase
LLVFSFPKFDLSLLAWVGLVPLLLSLIGKNSLKSFSLALLCGTLFWTGLAYWLMNVPKYTLLHYVILMPYLGSFFGLFGLFFCFISKRCGITTAFIAVPFIWIFLEYLRSHFFWLALPWGLLAHSQYQNQSIIQIASFAGAYGVGVSFLVMAVNASLALLVWALSGKRFAQGKLAAGDASWPAVIATLAVVLTIVSGSIIYGKMALSMPIKGDPIKISVIQGNIAQDKKWDKKHASFIMKTYSDLTLAASHHKPLLVAWPETATPVAINLDRRVYAGVVQIARKSKTPVLLGSAQRRKYEDETIKGRDYTNAAYLIDPNMKLFEKKQQYDKIHLLPFGEYLPAKRSIPWKLVGIEAVRGYSAGKDFTVFKLGAYRFSAPICWENVFPYVTRNFVKNGAQFIINITNAAYFGRTAAPYQVLSMNVFRAVENRRYVARAANIGISCIIDPYGHVVDRVKDEKGDDIFVRGYLTGKIIPLNELTFYTKYGDVFAWLFVLISGAFLLVSVVR